MRYLGGKTRIGKEIAEALARLAPPDTVEGYCEPFCGALGIMVHMVDKGYKKTKAYDKCKDIVLLWNGVKDGTFKIPRSVSERTWLRYKKDPTPSAMRAFMGFGCSFGGDWFTTFSKKYDPKSIPQAVSSIKRKGPSIKKITHIGHRDYRRLKLKGWLIYCDPPYKNTKGYKCTGGFDTDRFWDTVREWSKDNIVAVSEFTAPSDFMCIWKKKRLISVNTVKIADSKNVCEKLFVLARNVESKASGPKGT